MIVAVSGGFDPLHAGHVELFEEAARFGKLMVILNSDAWLLRKKGYVFMSWDRRKRIIEAIGCVDRVVDVDDSDNTVCEALRREMPDIFANSGDRTAKNTPELELCGYLDIAPLFLNTITDYPEDSSSEFIRRVNPGFS